MENSNLCELEFEVNWELEFASILNPELEAVEMCAESGEQVDEHEGPLVFVVY